MRQERTGGAAPASPPGKIAIWRDVAFRWYFAAVACSLAGTQIAFLAVPLVAVVALDADAGQVGLLGVLGTVAFLLLGLPVGAWLDRVRRRPVMIAADLARCLLMLSVPLAWWAESLTLTHLYVVAFLNGVCTVFFDIGAQSYLPSLVGRDRLMRANGVISSWEAGSSIAGPSIAGLLVRFLTAPVALLANAIAYGASALGLLFVRRAEPRPAEPAARRNLLRDIREGTGFVLRHRTLTAIALAGASTNLFIKMGIVVMPLIFFRQLGLGEAELGLFFTVGGLGVFLGSTLAERIAERLGYGRGLWILNVVLLPLGLLTPFIGRGPEMILGMIGWFSFTFRVGVSNVITVTLRQRSTPDEYLSRMNATMRVFITGALTVGAALVGLFGEWLGLRAVLWIVTVGLSLAWLPLFFSPLRTARELPEPAASPASPESARTPAS